MQKLNLTKRSASGKFITLETANSLIERFIKSNDPKANHVQFSIDNFLSFDNKKKCDGYTIFYGIKKDDEQTFIIIPTTRYTTHLMFQESAYNMGNLGKPPKSSILPSKELIDDAGGEVLDFETATNMINDYTSQFDTKSNHVFFSRRNFITYLKRLKALKHSSFAIYSGSYKNNIETIVIGPCSHIHNQRVPAFNFGHNGIPPKYQFEMLT